jgi:hypothetical protein
MACRIDVSLCKTAEEVKLRGFDYTSFLARVWTGGTVYEEGEVVRPLSANGFQYRAANTGQTKSRAPVFPITDGATVLDGGVTWQTEPISNESLRSTIDSSVWVVDDPSVTFSLQSIDNGDGRQRTSTNIHGGIAGGAYTIINTVIMQDGTVEEQGIALEVTEEVAE